MLRGRKDPASGKLIVSDIMANWDSFSGTVVSVADKTFVVELDRKNLGLARLASVTYDDQTEFSSSAPEDLVSGRGITVAGLVLKDGTLKGTTITVFNQDGSPARVPAGARILTSPR